MMRKYIRITFAFNMKKIIENFSRYDLESSAKNLLRTIFRQYFRNNVDFNSSHCRLIVQSYYT